MAGLKPATHLTFDCYGTLIDWETGILTALQPLLNFHKVTTEPQTILRLYVTHEARLEGGPWRPYRDILHDVCGAIGKALGVTFSRAECEALPDSLKNWLPFPDTIAALRQLKQHFSLTILSNIDDALFAKTREALGVAFDHIITAEQVRSYKPAEAHFREALRRLKVPADQILHVAQSLYHDHVPARRLGFRTAWVNRPSLLKSTGLAPKASAQPDIEVPDLQSLMAVLERFK
jgi:2-haloacid dehalogenase